MQAPRLHLAPLMLQGELNINFPALDNYVNYLRENRMVQQQVDALTAQVQALTNGLNQSTNQLESEIEKENRTNG